MMDPQIGPNHFANRRRSHEFSHAVIDQAAGCGQVRNIAGTAGFIDEVIRVDADTVAADVNDNI